MEVTKKMITPKSRKYSVIRLATVGLQKEQKHLTCSLAFMPITIKRAENGNFTAVHKIGNHRYCGPCLPEWMLPGNLRFDEQLENYL
jgi:hypothetical protein